MGRIARGKISKSIAFSNLHAESMARGESNDCTVKALALVAGISYDEAHEACRRMGRKDRCGMYSAEYYMNGWLRARGFKVERVNPGHFIEKYPGQHKNLLHVTTYHPVRFAKAFDDGNTYLFFTRGHVAAVVDGLTEDWSKTRAMRVTSIYRIVRL